MNTSKDNKWRNGKALERYTLIAPLLEGSLDPAKRLQMREDIASRNGISLRSLYRYEAAFKKEGFSGLKPAERPKQHSAKLPDNFKDPGTGSPAEKGSADTVCKPDHLHPGTGRLGTCGDTETLHHAEASL